MKNSDPASCSVFEDIRNGSIEINKGSLDRMKGKFSHIINSTRAFYYIRTGRDLVEVLEQRAIDGRDKEEFIVSLVECVKSPKADSRKNKESYQEIPRHVLDVIADEIGRKWWELAHHLDIPEGTIAEIEGKYPFSLKRQAYEALLVFLKQGNGDGRVSTLLKALGRSRRVDLQTIVEKELQMEKYTRKASLL